MKKKSAHRIAVHFSTKAAYTFVMFFILIIGSFIVYSYTTTPNPGHGADQVVITVNNVEKTLQEAVDAGDIGGGVDTFNLSKEYYYKCGNHNIPDEWQACFLVDVRHDDEGHDSDFRKQVYKLYKNDTSDLFGWRLKNDCDNDRQGSGVRCFRFFNPE